MRVHLIAFVSNGSKLGKLDTLSLYVYAIRFIVQNIVTGTTDHYRFKYTVSNLFHYLVDSVHKNIMRNRVAFVHHLLVGTNPFRESTRYIPQPLNGAVASILEQQQLIADIHGSVVVRSGGKQ